MKWTFPGRARGHARNRGVHECEKQQPVLMTRRIAILSHSNSQYGACLQEILSAAHIQVDRFNVLPTNLSDYSHYIFDSVHPAKNDIEAIHRTHASTILLLSRNPLVEDIEQFTYTSHVSNGPAISSLYDSIWLTDNYKEYHKYVETIYKREITLIPFLWKPSVTYSSPPYTHQANTGTDILVNDENASFNSGIWKQLLICEQLYLKHPAVINTVYAYNVPYSNKTAVGMIKSLTLYKQGHLALYGNVSIYDSLKPYRDSSIPKNVLYLSNQIVEDIHNDTLLAVLHAGIPIVHSSHTLREHTIGMYYDSNDIHAAVALMSGYNAAPTLDPQAQSHREAFLNQYSPRNTALLDRILHVAHLHDSPKGASSGIQMVVITANEERKRILTQQFQELAIPFPIVYFDASTPSNSASYLPEAISTYTARSLCCTRSHARAIEYAGLPASPPFTIVVEDDVALHTRRFVPVVQELMRRWDTFIDPKVGMVSLGWIPCSHYSRYEKERSTRTLESSPESKLLSMVYVLGTQAYMIRRDIARKHTPVLIHTTYAQFEKAIYKTLKEKHIDPPHKENSLAVDFVMPRVLDQVFLFPPVAIEQKGVDSIIGHTNEARHWVPFFKDCEHLRDEYYIHRPPAPHIYLCLPYFGKFPNYFQLYLDSVSINTDILRILLLTDIDISAYTLPSNVIHIPISLDDIRIRAARYLQEEYSITVLPTDLIKIPYKLCEFRPIFPALFRDYIHTLSIRTTDYIGWGDCDVIFGKLSTCIDIDKGYDIIGSKGHFTAFRYNALCCSLYTNISDYIQILQDDTYHFSDENGLQKVLIHFIKAKQLTYFEMFASYCDILPAARFDELTLAGTRAVLSHLVFDRARETLLAHHVDGTIQVTSYAHLQKRALDVLFTAYKDRFYIKKHSFSIDL